MGVIKRLAEAGRALFGRTTPVQRAHAAGHVPGHPITSKYEELNHGTDWNYVGIHAVAKQVSQATVVVFDESARTITKGFSQDSPEEQRKPVKDHPIAKLLDKPNPMKSGQEFLYQAAWQIRSTGGVVFWELRNEDGKPVEMYVLPWAWLTYQMPSEDHPLGKWQMNPPRGISGYFRGNVIGAGFTLDVRETIIAAWPHPLYPGEPLSPLTACSQIIDIAEKSEEATVAALQNSIRPSMIISLVGDPPQSVFDETMTRLKERKAGVHNTGDALVVGSETKTEIVSTRMAELDAVNVRSQNKEFVLAVQAVPSIATGGDNSGTYAGNAAVINTHVELSIQPECDLIAGKLTHRWRAIYGPDFEVEINAKRFDDPTLQLQRADKILAAVDKGAASIDEWRASMQLPPLPNGAGKSYEKAQPPTMPGMPGAQPPGQDDADPLALPDLEDDEPTDTTTGTIDPMRQEMPTQKRLAWLNGYAEGGH